MILTAGALVAREMVKSRPNETARLIDWDDGVTTVGDWPAEPFARRERAGAL